MVLPEPKKNSSGILSKKTDFSAKDSTSTSFTNRAPAFLNVTSVDLCKNGLYFYFIFKILSL